MVLTIRNNLLYTNEGEMLKEVFCPRKVTDDDLNRDDGNNFSCAQCNETVANTDYMTEDEIIAMLLKSPETCLYINLGNPLFEVEA